MNMDILKQNLGKPTSFCERQNKNEHKREEINHSFILNHLQSGSYK